MTYVLSAYCGPLSYDGLTNSTLRVIPSPAATFSNVRRDGFAVPFSSLLMSGCVMSVARDRSLCVIPRSILPLSMAIVRAGLADAGWVLGFYDSTIDKMRSHPHRPTIRLSAVSNSVPSNRLYVRCGYQLICTKSYYFDIAGNIELHLYERSLVEQ